jgi:hypothetical protein
MVVLSTLEREEDLGLGSEPALTGGFVERFVGNLFGEDFGIGIGLVWGTESRV